MISSTMRNAIVVSAFAVATFHVQPGLAASITPAPSPSATATSAITASPALLQFSYRGPGHDASVRVTDALSGTSMTESDNCSPMAHVAISPVQIVATIVVSPILDGSCAITVKDSRGQSVEIPVTIDGSKVGIQFITPANVPSTAAWGHETSGLRLSLKRNQTDVAVGAPVVATIDLENLGPDQDVDLGCNIREWYRLNIVDRQGRELSHASSDPVDCYSTMGTSQLKHDEVIEVAFPVDIRAMSEPGLYTLSTTAVLRRPAISRTGADGTSTYDQPILATLTSNIVQLNVRSTVPSVIPTPVVTSDATITYRAPLIYPQWAYERRIQGSVIVLVTIGVTGNVVAVNVDTSSGYAILDEAALTAARANRYTPYLVNGNPFQTQYKIYYEFRMGH
jgi:TonB family protein